VADNNRRFEESGFERSGGKVTIGVN